MRSHISKQQKTRQGNQTLTTLGNIHWVVPPPSNSGNEGLGWDSLLKMVHVNLVVTGILGGGTTQNIHLQLNQQKHRLQRNHRWRIRTRNLFSQKWWKKGRFGHPTLHRISLKRREKQIPRKFWVYDIL